MSHRARRDALVVVLIAAATLAAYARVVDFDFLNYDDQTYIVRNPHIAEEPFLGSAAWALTAGHASNWHPLTWISHRIDVALFGLDPAGPHAMNLALHALNALLLYSLLRLLCGRVWRSALVALFFALHPLHVESVAWIAERKDVLSTAFGLAAVLVWIGWVRRGGLPRYWTATALYAASLAAKPMLVTLPFLLLLLDFWPLGRLRSGLSGLVSCAREKIPFLLLSAASCTVTYAVQHAGGAFGPTERIPGGARIQNAVVAYVRYLGKTFWPTDQAVIYPHPYLPGGVPWAPWQVIGCALLLSGVTLLALSPAARRAGYPTVGWLFYLGALVPVIGLVQVGAQAMADRYTYLPLVGVFVALVWGAGDAVDRFARGRVAVRAGAAVVALALLVACGVRTSQQVSYWRDSVTLFSHAVSITPTNPIAWYNLGLAHETAGDLDAAAQAYRRSIEIHPGNGKPHLRLGIVLEQLGDRKQALWHVDRSLQIEPDVAEAHYTAANLLGDLGRPDEALRRYSEATRLKPDYASAYNNAANVLLRQKDYAAAIDKFEEALRADPRLAKAHHNLAIALWKSGRGEEALPHLAEAIRLDPENPVPRKLQSWILDRQGSARP